MKAQPTMTDEEMSTWEQAPVSGFATYDPDEHGWSRYDHLGCRCDVCKAAESAYRRRLRARRKAEVS